MPAPLVLVPGLLCTEALFARQIAALRDVTSITIADHTRHDSMAGIARDILAAAPPRFALAGLSMGVIIAHEILRQAPGRVERLALLDGRAELDNADTRASRRSYLEMARSGRFMEITRDHILPKLIHPARLKDAALVQTIFDMAEATGPAAFLRQETALLDRDDYTALLPEIRCPTLVVVGEADAITPVPMVQRMAQAIPGARFEVIADSGHLTTLERPAETSALLKAWFG
ncbi:MAG TPA: alpha/beta fold hydrolase [Verrucomicrobiae bacterium]|jgi:pimeloyl-ACP methyl ester carboxylesterase|nr:alpha/beta fold hydrolase [Verrucomicrobiae bacterium]